ncbi:MAG: tetratricopeptide repeat protein [Gemmatimonadetes bacterium]|nr:tetratricopeptide repeat protein [Gemmatimonadota bacterium]
MTKRPSRTNPSRARLLGALASLVTLLAAVTFASALGRADLWGFAPGLGLSIRWSIALPTVAIAVAYLIVRGVAGALPGVVLAPALLALAWLVRDALHLDGDGRLWLGFANAGQLHSVSAPVIDRLTLALVEGGGRIGLSAETSFALASLLAGGIYLGLVTLVRGELVERRDARVLALALLGPPILLFFGWIEIYAWVWVTGLAYLVLLLRGDGSGGRRARSAGSSVEWVGVALGVLLPLVHPTLIVLLPAALVAFPGRRGLTVAAGLAIPLAIAARVIVFGAGAWNPTAQPVDVEHVAYARGSARHLADSVQALLLCVPAAVILPWVAPRLDRVGRILAVATGGAVVGFLFVTPELGYARDWDLMSLPALPLSLWTAREVARLSGGAGLGRRVAAAAVGLTLACSSVWVAAHHGPVASLARAELLARETSGNSAFARSHLHDDLSQVLEERGRLEEARAQAGRAADLLPESARLRYRVGHLAFTARDLSKAEAELGRAVALDPGLFDAQYLLGIVRMELGASLAAIIPLENAARLHPEDARVRASLGAALARSGRVGDARAQMTLIARGSHPSREAALDYVARVIAEVENGQP